jgi:hypothetical protein
VRQEAGNLLATSSRPQKRKRTENMTPPLTILTDAGENHMKVIKKQEIN